MPLFVRDPGLAGDNAGPSRRMDRLDAALVDLDRSTPLRRRTLDHPRQVDLKRSCPRSQAKWARGGSMPTRDVTPYAIRRDEGGGSGGRARASSGPPHRGARCDRRAPGVCRIPSTLAWCGASSNAPWAPSGLCARGDHERTASSGRGAPGHPIRWIGLGRLRRPVRPATPPIETASTWIGRATFRRTSTSGRSRRSG